MIILTLISVHQKIHFRHQVKSLFLYVFDVANNIQIKDNIFNELNVCHAFWFVTLVFLFGYSCNITATTLL